MHRNACKNHVLRWVDEHFWHPKNPQWIFMILKQTKRGEINEI